MSRNSSGWIFLFGKRFCSIQPFRDLFFHLFCPGSFKAVVPELGYTLSPMASKFENNCCRALHHSCVCGWSWIAGTQRPENCTDILLVRIWSDSIVRKPIQVLVGKERLLYSGGWWPGEKADSSPKANSSLLIRGKELLKRSFRGVLSEREGATCRDSKVSSDGQLTLALGVCQSPSWLF